MVKVVNVTYKNNMLVLDEPLDVPEDAKLQVSIDMPEAVKSAKPYSALRYAASLKLEGPSDMSRRMDDYLYGADRDE